MQSIHKYRSLEQVLLAIKQQVIDSLPAARELNLTGTPEQIFYSLKKLLWYTPDPEGNELLQQLQTLLNWNGHNYHGLDGAGDCDCFTIAALACLYSAGYHHLYAVCAGNSNTQGPVHIFTAVYLANRKKLYNFDLTQPEFNSIRHYNFYQRLEFAI